MINYRCLVALILGIVALLSACSREKQEKEQDSLPENSVEIADAAIHTDQLVVAVESLLVTFDDSLLRESQNSFESPRRSSWSNLPAQMFPRQGARLGDMSTEQRRALYAFLQVALGAEGFRKVSEIILADELLGAANNWRLGWGGDNYWFNLFGIPSSTAPWGWQLGGHHLAINATIVGDTITLSPSFVGIEPAHFTHEGQSYQPLAAEVELAERLWDALDDSQQATASIAAPEDVLAGPGRDSYLPPAMGLPVSEMDSRQQALLLQLIDQWVAFLPDSVASRRLDAIERQLEFATFAWGQGRRYYRIQSPNLLIEFLIRRGLGAGSGHYHSIYRNPQNEYGVQFY